MTAAFELTGADHTKTARDSAMEGESGRAVVNPPVFDGHNDLLLRLYLQKGGATTAAFLEGDSSGKPAGHLDLPRARAAGFAGGMFAIFVPSAEQIASVQRAQSTQAVVSTNNGGDAAASEPPPEIVGLGEAQAAVLAMASLLFRIERDSNGSVRVCRTAADIRECLDGGILAPVLHIEGAEAIDRDLHMLEVLYQAGLRSLGPVWSRPNIFGHGVPFRFASTPDIGPGLTDVGEELIRACNQLGIVIDLSHLNEQGFWDVARLSDAPLVATHSNAHAICPHSRNLTGKQLAAIRESGGIVGVNFAVSFLRPDGRRTADTPIAIIADHVDFLLARLGEDHVAFGSDFDGALVPTAMGSVKGLPLLIEVLRARGYDQALLEKLCFRNWLGVLEKTWRN